MRASGCLARRRCLPAHGRWQTAAGAGWPAGPWLSSSGFGRCAADHSAQWKWRSCKLRIEGVLRAGFNAARTTELFGRLDFTWLDIRPGATDLFAQNVPRYKVVFASKFHVTGSSTVSAAPHRELQWRRRPHTLPVARHGTHGTEDKSRGTCTTSQWGGAKHRRPRTLLIDTSYPHNLLHSEGLLPPCTHATSSHT